MPNISSALLSKTLRMIAGQPCGGEEKLASHSGREDSNRTFITAARTPTYRHLEILKETVCWRTGPVVPEHHHDQHHRAQSDQDGHR
ncbi:hypothetical protein EYF80_042021 [Liparis tanakae]|uniref:Uncharacterized protein n=1 Tax=Liparis tanakae TaxID=230148 RepID=A0A4Z2G2M7_9TELE|nr:hypothetical protein EYF80_042021 [Liparis tanakae]